MASSPALTTLASELQGYIPQLQDPSSPSRDSIWLKVASSAQQLANGLRSPGGAEDTHGVVGSTALPTTLTSLLAISALSPRSSTSVPVGSAGVAAYEVLRVGANLSMDHDANRERLLQAKWPHSVLEILVTYAERVTATEDVDMEAGETGLTPGSAALSLSDLKIIKTAFGALLNSSMEYRPVRSVLNELNASHTILRLTATIYPSGSWRFARAGVPDDLAKEEWTWRSGLAGWSWRVLETLREAGSESPSWDSLALTHLIKSLDNFVPSSSSSSLPSFISKDIPFLRHLISTDVEMLQEIASQVESLTADSEAYRAALVAPSATSSPIPVPSTEISSLATLVRFIENGTPPPYWTSPQQTGKLVQGWLKRFSMCKGAVIKALVSLAGEEAYVDVLWEASSSHAVGGEGAVGGWFVQTMVRWIQTYAEIVANAPLKNRVGALRITSVSEEDADEENEVEEDTDEREDLIICATLCLGNLARKESYCVSLISPPQSLLPYLVPLLSPNTDLKLKHGVIGLLKHIGQSSSPTTKSLLGGAGVIEALVKSGIWRREADFAEVVQLGAIGIVKHLVASHVDNALRLFAPPAGGVVSNSGVDQILDIVPRTDSLAVRNEGTRVLVNLIKTLWTPPSASASPIATSPTHDEEAQRRRKAMDKLISDETADALGELIGRDVNARYPVLLNEGLIALTLFANHAGGVPHALTALVSPLGPEQQIGSGGTNVNGLPPRPASSQGSTSPSTSQSTRGGASSSSSSSTTALDMLARILANSSRSRLFPPELQSNVCSLLSAVGRKDVESELDEESKETLEYVKEVTKSGLVALARGSGGGSGGGGGGGSVPSSPVGVMSPMSPMTPGGGLASRGPNMVRLAAARTLTVWGMNA